MSLTLALVCVCVYSATAQYVKCLESAVSKLCGAVVAAWQRQLTVDMFTAVGFDRRCTEIK